MHPHELARITGDWDYSTLPGNVRVGPECWLERMDSFARFRSERSDGLVLGARTRVFTWTVFNVEPSGSIRTGSDCVLVGATFMCAGDIVLGDRVVISYQVTIADSDFHPVDPDQRRQDAIANAPFGDKSARPPYESRAVEIGDDVWIGIGALVLKGVKVGNGARIGPGAVVTRDVAPGVRVEGNPARVVASADSPI